MQLRQRKSMWCPHAGTDQKMAKCSRLKKEFAIWMRCSAIVEYVIDAIIHYSSNLRMGIRTYDCWDIKHDAICEHGGNPGEIDRTSQTSCLPFSAMVNEPLAAHWSFCRYWSHRAANLPWCMIKYKPGHNNLIVQSLSQPHVTLANVKKLLLDKCVELWKKYAYLKPLNCTANWPSNAISSHRI